MDVKSEAAQSYLVTELNGCRGTPVRNGCSLHCGIMSSKKRKDKSLGSSSKSFKQQKDDSNIDLLNRYFLEEEFKAKFAKAFRLVHILGSRIKLRDLDRFKLKTY